MFEIELKFYHRFWKNYFNKSFDDINYVFGLFTNLTNEFLDSEFRLVYKGGQK